MFKMKGVNIFVAMAFTAILLLGGCKERDYDNALRRKGLADIILKLNSSDSYTDNLNETDEPLFKAAPKNMPATTEEKQIFNAHIFLIPTDPAFVQDARHYYYEFANPVALPDIKMPNVYFGEYGIYILANNGKKLLNANGSQLYTAAVDPVIQASGINTQAAVKNLFIDNVYPVNLRTKGLPMVYYGEQTIASATATDTDGNPVPYNFELNRLMAKLYFTKFENQYPNEFQLFPSRPILVINPVRTTKPFDNTYIPDKFAYSVEMPVSSGVDAPIYLLGNCQPTPNPPTPDVMNRTSKYAPVEATSLSIGGVYKKNNVQKEFDFAIYLGDAHNDPNDYNIKPNNAYGLGVTFRDLENVENDDRISQTTVTVENSTISDYKYLSPGTTETINIKIDYVNVFKDILKLSASVSAGLSEAARNTITWTLTVDSDTPVEFTKEMSQYQVAIDDSDGKGTINIKLEFKYTQGDNGAPAPMTIDISNLRKTLKSILYPTLYFNS